LPCPGRKGSRRGVRPPLVCAACRPGVVVAGADRGPGVVAAIHNRGPATVEFTPTLYPKFHHVSRGRFGASRPPPRPLRGAESARRGLAVLWPQRIKVRGAARQMNCGRALGRNLGSTSSQSPSLVSGTPQTKPFLAKRSQVTKWHTLVPNTLSLKPLQILQHPEKFASFGNSRGLGNPEKASRRFEARRAARSGENAAILHIWGGYPLLIATAPCPDIGGLPRFRGRGRGELRVS
jgi:hypothetical protein